MQPFKLAPCYKDYIWGGEKLKKNYNKETELEIVAESWELSAHKDGSSVISEITEKSDAALLGMPFREFTERYPESVGTRARGKKFPILIKLIDSKNNLSIQVHPDDAYAKKYEKSFGKTELWHILEAEEGAFLYLGFNRNVEKGEIAELIESGAILGALRAVSVKKGDTFMIAAGLLHAINKGIVLAEIQQSSNLTYRVYDYGRVGADGRPRELHIEKAMAVMNTDKNGVIGGRGELIRQSESLSERRLAKCPYFTVSAIAISGEYNYAASEETFAAVLLTEGVLELVSEKGALEAKKGDCIFIPAGNATHTLRGCAEFLVTTY